jgi:hypothetical protein
MNVAIFDRQWIQAILDPGQLERHTHTRFSSKKRGNRNEPLPFGVEGRFRIRTQSAKARAILLKTSTLALSCYRIDFRSGNNRLTLVAGEIQPSILGQNLS